MEPKERAKVLLVQLLEDIGGRRLTPGELAKAEKIVELILEEAERTAIGHSQAVV